MSKKNPVYELMIAFDYKHFAIRVWWTVPRRVISTKYNGADKAADSARTKIMNHIHLCFDDANPGHLMVAEQIGSFDQCAAVEVLDRYSRNGMVYYPDWN